MKDFDPFLIKNSIYIIHFILKIIQEKIYLLNFIKTLAWNQDFKIDISILKHKKISIKKINNKLGQAILTIFNLTEKNKFNN